MQPFDVEEDLAVLVERLARKRPFENLSFNDALRRVLQEYLPPEISKELRGAATPPPAASVAVTRKGGKKAPSPSPAEWIALVPELRTRKGLNTWKAICDSLKIGTAGDSARRKLKNWVKANRPAWPAVPDID